MVRTVRETIFKCVSCVQPNWKYDASAAFEKEKHITCITNAGMIVVLKEVWHINLQFVFKIEKI